MSLLFEALKRPSAWGDDVSEVRVVETHISWVFLTGKLAYKIKKPIKLPFLDFSTLELRRNFCDEEIRLNRRLAPEVYLDVVPIGGSPTNPRVGEVPAIEYAVRMHQFGDDARLDRQLDASETAQALRMFATELAHFHAGLPSLLPRGAGAHALASMHDNFTALERNTNQAEIDPVRHWIEQHGAEFSSLIDYRASRDHFRECHGDLHLENLLVEGGRIVAFDALEFDVKLREIDVASEAAFVVMDLVAHGRADLGFVFLTAYLEASGDYDALSVLRFYLVYRAYVRAKVLAIKASHTDPGSDTIGPYLLCARRFVETRTPLLLITHGLSGSGKTYITNTLVGALQAVRVRSDLERKRKRVSGLEPHWRTDSQVGGGIYDVVTTERVYARLAEVAATAIRNGFDTIVDATFLARSRREQFRAVATRAGARFAILDCDAPEAVLRGRVAARDGMHCDASEAGIAVLESQIKSHETLTADEMRHAVHVATDRPLDIADVLTALASL